MRTPLLSAAILFLATATLCAVPAGETFRLWEGDAPGALGKQDQDIPTLTLYQPAADKAAGSAIVVCPGGGYGGLAPHEGDGYASWLSDQGITCFVLKYRLGSKGYRHPVMMQDVQRALRTVRAGATKWSVDPKRIGVMGSSAGGHLATTAVTHYDAGKSDATDEIERASCRPDFGVICYGVISMEDGVTHGGSKNNLLGKDPDSKLVESLSNDKQVTKDTPPCFVWSTGEDKAVLPENSFRFVQALRDNKIPFDFHIYQKGGHGIGLSPGKNGVPANDVHPWGKDLVFWLRQNGWAK
jgi:acetyl esterase/lipase